MKPHPNIDALANPPTVSKNDNFHGEQTMPRHEIVGPDGKWSPILQR